VCYLRSFDSQRLLPYMNPAWFAGHHMFRWGNASRRFASPLADCSSAEPCWRWTHGIIIRYSENLQVDGPWHFTSNTLEPLGPTLHKRRQLARAGWQMVAIPFHEWIQLPGRAAKQVRV